MVVQTFLHYAYVNQFCSLLGFLINKSWLDHVFRLIKHNLLSGQKTTNLVVSWLQSFFNRNW